MDTDPKFQEFLQEIDAHFAHVVEGRLGWKVLERPQFRVGGGNVVLRFRTAHGTFIFRVPRYSQEQLRRVALAYRFLGDSGMLPERIYFDGKCVLERHVEGLPLSARTGDGELRALGRALATLHALPAQGFGLITHESTGMFADVMAWFAAPPPEEAALDDAAALEEEFTDAEQQVLRALHVLVAELPARIHTAPPRLGHGDLWRSNVVVRPDGGINLIDWDRLGAYPREHDFLFMADADLDPRQKELVLEAYGHPLDRSLVQWFSLRRLMRDPGKRPRAKLAAARQLGAWVDATAGQGA